jgi:septum formation protein
MKIILGSSSKYRRGILENAGYQFEAMSPDVDEMAIRTTDYFQLPLLLAQAKSKALVSKTREPAIIITGDVVVVCDGQLYEKPESEAQLRAWLKKYGEGHPAEVVCGLVVVNTHTGKKVKDREITRVTFKPMPESMITEFIQNGDPYGRAGGFAVQLPIFHPYIEKMEGTVESMMGMPLHLLEKLLKEVQS